ncbi:MAG TPA: hypothetical protein VMF66_13860 [Candidatus Acidoferrum sp.]|nr:hypothetical protein [Candidatus Acidoferrum sp.]
MYGVLVLAVLTIKSSYSRNSEAQLESEADVPDTLQWWFSNGDCWRIRTYAQDHDIHVHRLGKSQQITLELAQRNNLKHYGDVIKVQHVLDFFDCRSEADVSTELRRVGLVPRMETSPGGFTFWKPDDVEYRTKSLPK